MRKPNDLANRIAHFLPGDARAERAPQAYDDGKGIYERIHDARDRAECGCPSSWALGDYGWCERKFYGWWRATKHTQSCRKANG